MFIYTTMPRNNLLAGNSKKNVFTELEALAQKKKTKLILITATVTS